MCSVIFVIVFEKFNACKFGKIDAKGTYVVQPIWLSGCLKKVTFVLKMVFSKLLDESIILLHRGLTRQINTISEIL